MTPDPAGGWLDVTELRPLSAVDRTCASLLGRPMAWGVGLMVAAMLATWLPHYLLWPWWPDLDAWAAIAQGWDAGVLPYRDVTLFNFPGQVEMAYVSGKLLGWGRTTPAYALDAAMLLGLGGLLWGWSRRMLGRGLPGLVAFAAVMSMYANLDYSEVAQRDWQGPLLAVGALLAIQMGRGRPSLVAAAAMMAAGFAIRPHVVLFLPAIATALWLREDGTRSHKAMVGRCVVWGAAFGGFVLVAFAPLLFRGLVGDLVRGVARAGYGGEYNQTSSRSIGPGILKGLGLQGPFRLATWADVSPRLEGWKTLAVLAALLATAWWHQPRPRGLGRPWVAALGLALLYEPLHPKRHAYLILPLRLVTACGLAMVVDGLLRATARRPAVGLVVLIAIVAAAVPGIPRYCSFEATVRAFGDWGKVDGPALVPIGAEKSFRPAGPGLPGDDRSPYTWADYRRTLAYLRRNTGPTTVVANALRGVPFPAINGPTGRVSPFPAESGLIWIWSVDPKAEAAFVANLDRTPGGSVVVWSPDEPAFDPRLQLPALRAAIRRSFVPEQQFGAIQVWRKPR